MKRKTYNNVLKAIKLVQAKGYDRETARRLALQCFENAEANNNVMPVEWYIDKILTKEEYEKEYSI